MSVYELQYASGSAIGSSTHEGLQPQDLARYGRQFDPLTPRSKSWLAKNINYVHEYRSSLSDTATRGQHGACVGSPSCTTGHYCRSKLTTPQMFRTQSLGKEPPGATGNGCYSSATMLLTDIELLTYSSRNILALQTHTAELSGQAGEKRRHIFRAKWIVTKASNLINSDLLARLVYGELFLESLHGVGFAATSAQQRNAASTSKAITFALNGSGGSPLK